MFVALLHSNGSYSIVGCVFVAGGMYLASRYLAVNIYSDFAIPAVGPHVTVCIFVRMYVCVNRYICMYFALACCFCVSPLCSW
jgi:hypothetical protein